MPIFFRERRLESCRHVVLTHLAGYLDQELPPVIIGEFGHVNGMQALRDGHTGIGEDLHQADRSHRVRIGHRRDARGIRSQLP